MPKKIAIKLEEKTGSRPIRKHGSFRAHFDAVCTGAIGELELLETFFKNGTG